MVLCVCGVGEEGGVGWAIAVPASLIFSHALNFIFLNPEVDFKKEKNK